MQVVTGLVMDTGDMTPYRGYRDYGGYRWGGGQWHQDLLTYWTQIFISIYDLPFSHEPLRSKKGGEGSVIKIF